MDDRIVQRFWSRVACGAPDECWLWTGQRYLRGKPSPTGYGRFYDAQRKRTMIASRFVLELKLGRQLHPTIDRHIQACHHCDNSPCCNPQHIFEGTNSSNMRDSIAKNRRAHIHSENSLHVILTNAEVLDIRRRYAQGEYGVDLAKEFGVSRPAIYQIVSGRNWKKLDGPRSKIPKGPRPDFLPKHTLLTPAQVEMIYRRRIAGERGADLAREFGVSQATVSAIYKKRNWKRLW